MKKLFIKHYFCSYILLLVCLSYIKYLLHNRLTVILKFTFFFFFRTMSWMVLIGLEQILRTIKNAWIFLRRYLYGSILLKCVYCFTFAEKWVLVMIFGYIHFPKLCLSIMWTMSRKIYNALRFHCWLQFTLFSFWLL